MPHYLFLENKMNNKFYGFFLNARIFFGKINNFENVLKENYQFIGIPR